jgi:predicted nucleotidyltransferase
MAAATEALAAAAAAFERLGCRWYLFGAQALAVHGRVRSTEDVDVTVECSPTRAKHLWSALRDAGFSMRVDDPESFIERTYVLPLHHDAADIDVDLILAGSGLEKMFLDRAETHDLGGVRVPVITAEDFIIAKVLAQRPKDIEDVVSVLVARRSDLDVEYVRQTLRELEQALDQSDLIPVLDDALRRSADPA